MRQLRRVQWYELKRLISTKMAECFVVSFVKKSASYNAYRSGSSSWILAALWVAVSTNVISLMTKAGWQRIFSLNLGLKQRNRWHKTGHFEVQESARAQRLHLSNKYVVVIPCFHSTLRLKFKLRELIRWIFFCRVLSITVRRSSENIWLKCIKCFF